MLVPMTLSDPNRVSRSLYTYKSNISKTVRLTGQIYYSTLGNHTNISNGTMFGDLV